MITWPTPEYMEQSDRWKANSRKDGVENTVRSETRRSQPTTEPKPEPDKSSFSKPFPFLSDAFTYYLPSYTKDTGIVSLYLGFILIVCRPILFRRVREIAKSDQQLRHVCPHEKNLLPLERFPWNLIWEYFFESLCREIKVSLKSDKNNRYFT